MQAPTDLGSASLPPSLTAQTGGSTVDHKKQQHFVTAQSGSNAVAPVITESSIQGGVTYNFNNSFNNFNPSQNTGVEDGASGSDDSHRSKDESIITDTQKLKSHLKEKFADIFDELENNHIPLNEIFTELYITEGGSGGVNTEHEVRQNERAFRRQACQETPIILNDIFEPGHGRIRTVLTKGIAGIGKTVSVQKFILDWAEGKANQNIDLIFPISLQDLYKKKQGKFSLIELLKQYFPELTSLPDKIKSHNHENKVLFIFDGLDECKLPLDFQNNEMWCDVTTRTSVDTLLTNLIAGDLLGSALLWITSRPAAANQIPPKCIHRVTEVRGFNDAQKEEYFRKRFRNQDLADIAITHMKASKSLYIMCYKPVICCISAAVLETVFGGSGTEVIPKSLTEMYTYFLLIQMNMNKKKYHNTSKTNSNSDLEIILKLGELAFLHLESETLIFDEKDLTECDFNFTEASMHSGLCTQISKENSGVYQEKGYCFVHLSIQEYLAALFVFHSFVNGNINLLSPEEQYAENRQEISLSDLHRTAVDEALRSVNGHLDLFLRFLLGLSLECTQKPLQDLLAHKGSSSLVAGRNGTRIKGHVSSQTPSREKSLMSKTRNMPLCGLRITFHVPKLLRSLRSTSHVRDTVLTGTESSSQSTEETVQYIKKKIRADNSTERIQNLFHCLNELNDNSLVEEIETSLRSGKLFNVTLDPGQCSAVAFVLQMPQEVLDVFELKTYNTSEAGRLRLLTIVRNCRRAMLSDCNLTEESCKIVASAVQLDSSTLVELDLSHNGLGDSGVELLCAGLRNPNCKLQIIRLSGCQVTERGCASLASALSSNPSHLRELDLSSNHPGESGVRALSAALEDPSCRLEKLNVDHGGENRLKPGPRKYACQLTLDPNTAHKELILSDGNRKVTRSEGKEEPYPDHPERFVCYPQVLCREGLTGRCYWEVEWTGGENDFAVGVAYQGISRNGLVFFHDTGNIKSWSLAMGPSNPHSWVNGKCHPLSESSWGSRRVGVYLNWPAGILSFFRISDTLTHLHTFHTTFTEPVYPVFRVSPDSSLSLCSLG